MNTIPNKKKLKFLHESLRLNNQDETTQMITLFPSILLYSISTLHQKIDFFTKEMKMNQYELRHILVCMPSLLGLSEESNLRPKINYLLQSEDKREDYIHNEHGTTRYSNENDSGWERERGGILTLEELKEFVLAEPALLAYSLEGRIIPRLKKLDEASISLPFAPKKVMCWKDAKFQKWIIEQSETWTAL